MRPSGAALSGHFLIYNLITIWIFLSCCITADKTSADYYVTSLPGQPDGPLLTMHAGHVEITPEHNGNLFFWHFQNRHVANRQRTVLWLNGGPGCSSEDGALMEIGPYRVTEDQKLKYVDGAWDEFANVLFVDNPVGTGFSFVDTNSFIHELTEMADQMIVFLEKWFKLFPEYEDNDLYIAGESYAGQHIPYLAKAILDRNDAAGDHKRWNLSGLLIGNGWIAPREQYKSYLSMAYSAGLIEQGSAVGNELEQVQQRCLDELSKPEMADRVDIPVCENILQEILAKLVKNDRCPNMYDVRLDDTYPDCGMNWPPDLTQLKPYLRKPEVIEALHVSEKKSGWTECSGSVSRTFNPVKSKAAITFLPQIIERVPTILFSGDQDLICNHLGTEDFIHNMEWNGGKGFELSPGTWAPKQDWTFEGEPAGFYQSARNLTYIVFYNSSHMVPFDYPRRTRDMLDRFMGVDIASIGGKPADSRLDGEKGMETSVGGHPNSTSGEQAEKEKVEEAKWQAYYKSGEVALIVVAILAGFWAWYVWRDRRRRAGYQGLFGGNSGNPPGGHHEPRDVEAADFDEAELDNLHPTASGPVPDEQRYSLGGDSSDDEDHEKYKDISPANGYTNGHAREEKLRPGAS